MSKDNHDHDHDEHHDARSDNGYDKRRIDWDAIAADSGGNDANLDRLRRVVDLFDRLHLPQAGIGVETFRWGSLEVFEPLGAGSFGTVYRAWDGHLKREVALKLLPADTPGAAGWLEEARRLARVRHPNVVAILGAEVEDDFAGIWMELSDGQSVDSVLTDEATLPEPAVQELARALVSALLAIHEQGLVHGDLKGSNVLVEPNGRVLLLDFGSATEAAARGPAQTGSPLSTAPEVLAGRALTPAADLYALGVLLYRCLSGGFPFTGEDVARLRQSQETPPDLSVLPRDYRPLLASLLASDPADRPNPDEVLARLTTISAAPERRRKRFAAGAVFTSLVIGLLIAALGWWQTGAARDAEQHAAEQARASLQLFQDVVGAAFEGTHGQDARVIDVLEQAERQVSLDKNQPAYVRAMVHYVVGASYLGLGRETDGLALLDESRALLASEQESQPEALARILVQQGLHWCDADAVRADAIAQEIRRIAADQLPSDHSVFAAALKIEACAAQRRGDDAVAEQKLREALALRPLDRFPADQSAIGTTARLATVLLDQRRVAEALPLMEQARSRALELFGPEHDFPISSAAPMAQMLIETSRFDEAVSMLEQTLIAVDARSGPQSSQWIATASTLATALARAGDSARALSLNDRVLEAANQQLGASHRFTLTVMSNRGIRLKELGRLDEAESAMAEAANAVESAVGTTHPLALINHVNRVEVLLMLNRTAEAVALGRAALSISLDALGAEHGISAGAQAYLARALAAAGKIAEAEFLFHQALAFQVKHNRDSIQTFETRYFYAEILANHGRVEDAQIQLEALEPALERLPADHPLLDRIAALEQSLP